MFPRHARLLASLAATLAVGACGGAPAAERIPVVPLTTGASPDVPGTLDPQAAPAPAATPAPHPAAVPAATVTGGTSLPVAVDIPAIGVHVHGGLMALGLTKSGAVSVPPLSQPQALGYYGRGSAPCSAGPAATPFTLLGHIDGDGRPGVLANLRNLKPGDTVTVGLDNGRSCTYRITKLAEFHKQDLAAAGKNLDFNKIDAASNANAAMAREMWGPVTQGSIRIDSCGGPYVGPPLFYRDNLSGEGVLA